MSDQTPAGWYPDPHGDEGQRYWDGAAWTNHTSGGDAPAGSPSGGDAPAGSPPGGDAPAGSPSGGGGGGLSRAVIAAIIAGVVVLLVGGGIGVATLVGDDSEETSTDGSEEQEPRDDSGEDEESTDGSTSVSSGDFCDQIADLEEQYGGMDPTAALSDPESAMQTLNEMVGAIEDLDAPAEIAGDLDTLATALQEIADLQATVAEDPQAAMEAMENIDLGGLQTAGRNLDQYTRENC